MFNKLNLYLTLGGTALAAYFYSIWFGLAFYLGCQVLWCGYFLWTGTGLKDL